MRTNQPTFATGIISPESLDQVQQYLQSQEKVMILTHKNPDGDAVGSALGLHHILRSKGHETMVVIPDTSPDFLKWLPGYQEVIVFDRKPEKMKQFAEIADVVFFLDFNAPDRLGLIQNELPGIKGIRILVDHHPEQEPFADVGLVNIKMSSTAELLCHMIRELGWEKYLERKSATCLMTGIITDTLGFRVNSTNPFVFSVVANLIELGADKDRIFEKVYNQYSVNRMKLLGYCLDQKMVVNPEKRVAYISLTKSEMKHFRHLKGDTEGFVNYPLSIKNVVFSVLFTEQDDHIKLSLRSKGAFPANAVATKYFHGGGHLNAAGGKSYTSMEETLKRFEEIVDLYTEELKKF